MTPAALPGRPLLKPWYRVAVGGGRVVLEYAHSAVVFEGAAARTLLPALLPLLDGTRSVDDVVELIGDAARPAIENALDLLARKRLLTEETSDGERAKPVADAARFLAATSARDLAPHAVSARLAAARVVVAGAGPAAVEVARLLQISGVGQLERTGLDGGSLERDLVVAAPDVGELPRLRRVNEALLETATPWLPVLPYDGRLGAVGPLVLPGETCCYACYLLRRAANVDYGDEFWLLEEAPAAYPVAAAVVTAVAGVAATVALRWLVDRDPALPGVLHGLELGSEPRLERHFVYRVPRCPVCSESEHLAPPLPWFDAEVAA